MLRNGIEFINWTIHQQRDPSFIEDYEIYIGRIVYDIQNKIFKHGGSKFMMRKVFR